MAKKRKSRGRGKGGKGRSDTVQCYNCGALIPRDKAIRVEKPVSLVDPMLAKELKKAGTFIPKTVTTRYLCVSCAVHFGIVKVRAREERKLPPTQGGGGL
ncbi:MAG: 30S ribosomal protein S26e [Thermoproteota archaeon]|jgi:small subunit ribosomal protein S26e